MVNLFELPVELVEYIILPDFGQRIILRFELSNSLKVSYEEANNLESFMRKLAGTDYWVTLVGDSYKYIVPNLRQCLLRIDQRIQLDQILYCPTQHSDHILADAQMIQRMLDLNIDYLLWEIEISISENIKEPIIRIIDIQQEGEKVSVRPTVDHLRVGGTDFAVVYMQNDPSFVGCVKAYIMAELQHRVLMSYFADFG